MDELEKSFIEKGAKMISGHLNDYSEEICNAFHHCDGDLAISLGLKFSIDKDGIKISTNIQFIESRIKDGISVVINPQQLSLF